MTQETPIPRSQILVNQVALPVEDSYAQLEITIAILQAQLDRLREVSAEARNVATSLSMEGD